MLLIRMLFATLLFALSVLSAFTWWASHSAHWPARVKIHPAEEHRGPSGPLPGARAQSAEGAVASRARGSASSALHDHKVTVQKYYDELTREENPSRDPHNVNSFAVHRWLGADKSTLQHYELVRNATQTHWKREGGEASTAASTGAPRVLDAGCGLGAGLLYLETAEPTWRLFGVTLSQSQSDFIVERLPAHRFRSFLRSFDDVDDIGVDDFGGADAASYRPIGGRGAASKFDLIYSIEALVHSPDLGNTLRKWSAALSDHGLVVIVDDFVGEGENLHPKKAKQDRSPSLVEKESADVAGFRRAWLLPSLTTMTQFQKSTASAGLVIAEDRDVGVEYDVTGINYGGTLPPPPAKDHAGPGGSKHRAWAGTVFRARAMILKKLEYRMIVLRKQTWYESKRLPREAR